MKPILVTCYVSPDLDGTAGAIAYAEFLTKTGVNCEAGIIGEPHDEAKYIFERFGFAYPKFIPNSDAYNQVIIVDASSLNGLEGKVTPEKVIEIIDHRKINEAEKFPDAKVQIELVGSAATLITEKFIQNTISISKESATLLYGAIISNTLNFKGTITTDRDKKAAQWLNSIIGLKEGFWKELFIAKSDLTGKKLEARIRGDFARFEIGGKKIGIAQIEIIGVKKLLTGRETEIQEVLNKIKAEMDLDLIFQNTIELEGGKNFFITNDTQAKNLLERVFDIKFIGNTAERPNLIMRKQIVPLIMNVLEK